MTAITADNTPAVLLITGMSGAGRSSVLAYLEDLGWEAVDNLPFKLLDRLLAVGVERPLALGIDIRTRDFDPNLLLHRIRAVGAARSVRVIFCDADDDVLRRRFTETRRRHPLAGDRPVTDGIRLERQRVGPLLQAADMVLDTSLLAPADLKRVVGGHFALDRPGLSVFVTSFSFARGLPRDADLVFDVRFLRNPYYDETLRPLTGRDATVARYVEEDPAFDAFFDSLTGLLGPLLPRYEAEGKSYLTIAIGCTGGRHRSVHVSEKLASWLADLGRSARLAHRDLPPKG